MKPIIEAAVEMFGADRCLHGSNFPIERLWTDYGTLYRTFRAAIAHLSEKEQHASGTARGSTGFEEERSQATSAASLVMVWGAWRACRICISSMNFAQGSGGETI